MPGADVGNVVWGLTVCNCVWLSFEGAVLGCNITAGLCDGAAVGSTVPVGGAVLGATVGGTEWDRLDGGTDGAALDGTRLDGAALDGAALDGTRLDGAALDGTRLDGTELGVPVSLTRDGSGVEGSRVGWFVGSQLGVFVGVCDGTSVGNSVGTDEGIDGLFVGVGDGTGVGISVGTTDGPLSKLDRRLGCTCIGGSRTRKRA